MSTQNSTPRDRIKLSFFRAWKLASKFWGDLTKPDSSIKESGLILRARLLATLSSLMFIINLMGVIAGIVSGNAEQPFSKNLLGVVLLGVVSLLAYVFSRTSFINMGSTIFTLGISLVAYTLAPASGSISIALYSALLPALVIGATLLSGWGLLFLVLANSIAVSFLPIFLPAYSQSQSGTDAINFLMVGITLLILVTSRNLIERHRLADLQRSNAELRLLQSDLEQRVVENTRELAQANQQAQARSGLLQSAAEISQTIALVSDPDDLLPLIAGLIGQRFGFYHVGVFLLDETHEYAVLRAANSRGGQKMLARNHRLRLGKTSIVGYVCQTGLARVALDVGTDATFFDNPDLPDTHSEVALPLKVGERVIGALDVQSTEVAAFRDEELGILTALANQVAVAIQNARLYDETRRALSEARQFTQGNLMLSSKPASGFTFTAEGRINPAPALRLDEIQSAVVTGKTLVQDQDTGSNESMPAMQVPIRLRDQLIGVLNIQSTDSNRMWSADEIALVQTISERAAFAMENARLFETASRRAEQEKVVSRISERIGASTNIDRILQTVIEELGKSLNATRTYVQLTTIDRDPNDDKTSGSSQGNRP